MTENLVLEHLRLIRADLAELKKETASNSLQISAMGQQFAGLTSAVYGTKSDMEDIKQRLARIERRLELAEPETL
ncbi:hypothetical protein Thiowin_02975 [Thiorhodovibrio winogradskyi]|uniref:Uncharacterized protein n=1 Tax=Thiorhodovibrio winogradskyi TaxID=77007 RepID=A0ABZ0SBU7_9GAMM|nr:hypothetical protein [Thiorhodovibrio winogradskyi]